MKDLADEVLKAREGEILRSAQDDHRGKVLSSSLSGKDAAGLHLDYGG